MLQSSFMTHNSAAASCQRVKKLVVKISNKMRLKKYEIKTAKAYLFLGYTSYVEQDAADFLWNLDKVYL